MGLPICATTASLVIWVFNFRNGGGGGFVGWPMGLAVASVGGGILWAALADRSVDDVLDTLPLSADDRATLRDDLATSDLSDAARATARRKVAAELGEGTKQGVSRASRARGLHRS